MQKGIVTITNREDLKPGVLPESFRSIKMEKFMEYYDRNDQLIVRFKVQREVRQ